MKHRYILALLGTLLILGLLVACSSSSTSEESLSTENAENSNIDEDALSGSQEDIIISTQYGDLYYPEQWTEFVKTTQENSGDAVVVKFEAEINGNTYELFEVTINGDGGTSVGEITDADGVAWNVAVNLNELPETSELTEGEQNRLYAMQEDINYIIDNLK
ncbi:MAG: hypothetical protein LUG47_07010 [Clostridiales bacterium]|nr:hypothetical protein [Clostridiales bacterium]